MTTRRGTAYIKPMEEGGVEREGRAGQARENGVGESELSRMVQVMLLDREWWEEEEEQAKLGAGQAGQRGGLQNGKAS